VIGGWELRVLAPKTEVTFMEEDVPWSFGWRRRGDGFSGIHHEIPRTLDLPGPYSPSPPQGHGG